MGQITIDDETLHLWAVKFLPIFSSGPNNPFVWHIASKERLDKRKVRGEAMNKFDSDWWNNYLVSDIEYRGTLDIVDGHPLYHKD